MLELLKKQVCRANKALVKHGLVIFTWGNVSAIDKSRKIVAIKPSGIEYDILRPEDIVLVDLEGRVIEGGLNPSSDTPTHLVIYRNFPAVNSVVHTHSTYATVFSQLKREIPCLGTTHADHFYGSVPVTRDLKKEEVENGYEENTGNVIVERFAGKSISPEDMPACLVASHGPFTWGKTPEKAVYNAAVLEQVAKMAAYHLFDSRIEPISQHLLDKHFLRKHGPKAYYGQKRD
jgi:L-ribulose-5-phosphate 4-epimerase